MSTENEHVNYMITQLTQGYENLRGSLRKAFDAIDKANSDRYELEIQVEALKNRIQVLETRLNQSG